MAMEGQTGTERPETRRNHNGAEQAPGTAAANGQENPSVTRAEEMVDRLAERAAHYTALLGRKVLWLGARVREEAEDIWAEAQSIRRGEKPPTPPSGQE